MKIALVYSDVSGVERYGARKFYHGVGYISAVLKAAGHEASLLYMQRELSAEEFLSEIDARSPDLVGFSSTTHQHPFVERCAALLKEHRPGIFVLSGGTHPTLLPEGVAACDCFDVVCVGEGEHAILELAERLEQGRDYFDVRNLWMKRDDNLIRNPLRPLIADLDSLPFVDRDIFDYEEMLTENDAWIDMLSGRGCPYDCSYCCNPGLKKRFAGLGRYVRFRSVGHVMSEIRVIRERFPIKVINFQDDTFTLNRNWTLTFCEAYGQEFDYPFWINTRVERLVDDEEVVAALARAGCQGVRIGIESGNEWLRTNILKRRMSNDDIARTFKLARRYGLLLYSCNMLGLPGETAAMIQETIKLNRRLNPDEFQFSVFYPYPMTELHDETVGKGMLREGESLTSYYSRRSILDLPDLTPEELEEGYDGFAALKRELALRRRSPLKYHIYRLFSIFTRGDIDRVRAAFHKLKKWLRRQS
jgi:radical SAM superfamily enzyme YgiQ (UPF0313 family)